MIEEAEALEAQSQRPTQAEIDALLNQIEENQNASDQLQQEKLDLQQQLQQALGGTGIAQMDFEDITPKPVPDDVPFARWRNLLILNKGYFVFDMRIIEPKMRVYFDIGDDDEDEVDIFRDGNLSATINVFEVRLTRYFFDETRLGYDVDGNGKLVDRSPVSWGFNAGAGIGIPAQDSEDGMTSASNAPVVVFTIGIFLEIDLTNLDADERKAISNIIGNNNPFSSIEGASAGATVGVELGYAIGFSADEMLEDVDDGALYFGLTFHVPF
ncbi:MAG: hypothetical protein ACIAXF_01120 [Phycisphaerales bacterium JB063]